MVPTNDEHQVDKCIYCGRVMSVWSRFDNE